MAAHAENTIAKPPQLLIYPSRYFKVEHLPTLTAFRLNIYNLQKKLVNWTKWNWHLANNWCILYISQRKNLIYSIYLQIINTLNIWQSFKACQIYPIKFNAPTLSERDFDYSLKWVQLQFKFSVQYKPCRFANICQSCHSVSSSIFGRH